MKVKIYNEFNKKVNHRFEKQEQNLAKKYIKKK